MAEEVKKTPKPRKPRTPKPEGETAPKKPKAPKAVTTPEALEALEKFEEKKIQEVEEAPVVEETPVVEEKVEETSIVEETPVVVPPLEEPVSVKLPEDAPTFEEYSRSLESGVASIKKLNPNLPDTKSKWVAQIPYSKGTHIIFKGSYPKAYKAAENWNKTRGFETHVEKIRSK